MTVTWKAGDRFRLKPVLIDAADCLVFELTTAGRARGRGRRGDGWYFYAPLIDSTRTSRWYAVRDLERDLADGKIVRVAK